MVTFTSGAALLVDLGIVQSITREGLRKIAKTHPEWPFGPERPHPYGKLSNAQTMDTEPFLEFFTEKYESKGRGPDLGPRRRRSADPE